MNCRQGRGSTEHQQWVDRDTGALVSPALLPKPLISSISSSHRGARYKPRATVCRCSHTARPTPLIAHMHTRSQLPFGRSWSSSASGEAPGPSCSTSLPLWCWLTTTRRSVLRKVIAASARLPRGGSSQSRSRGRCHRSLRTKATWGCRCDRTSIRIRPLLKFLSVGAAFHPPARYHCCRDVAV